MILVEPATPYAGEQRAWIAWARGLASQGRRPIAIVATIDAKDFDRAAAARESEKELLAEQDRLIAQWSAGVDVATLGRELDWLRDELNRLQGLLLQNGIEPEQPLRRPEDPTQQTA